MERDLQGYGPDLPEVSWPDDARLAINFVINYEEGAERTPINGDKTAESYGGEFQLSAKPKGQRHLSMESLFEYGSRSGIWRLCRLFDDYQIPVTFFATGLALSLNPALIEYLRQSQHEVAGHGWRWIDYSQLSASMEKKHIQQTIDLIEQSIGKRPLGWYTGRTSPSTRAILLEIGGFLYDSDSYADDLPYKLDEHLIIPYTLDCNDFRYTTNPGFINPDDFFHYLKFSFDYLYQENRTSMMTIGIHPRISGHPGRCQALKQFILYIKKFKNIWITRRVDIARHWLTF